MQSGAGLGRHKEVVAVRASAALTPDATLSEGTRRVKLATAPENPLGFVTSNLVIHSAIHRSCKRRHCGAMIHRPSTRAKFLVI
jgi:hypothetical protein